MIKVMNAKSAGNKLEKLLDDHKYIAECKYDGYRAICDNGEFHSRLGNSLSAKVPHLTQILKEHNVILDGELCMTSATANSSDVTKILGALPEKAVARQEELGKLRYVVFDILRTGGMDLTQLSWSHRREVLERFFDAFVFNELIDLSQIYTDKRGLLGYAESNGLEGIMIKRIDALYYPGKRPEGVWYKVKKSMTYDVVCTGFTAGKGKFAGLIGAIEFSLYKDGALTYCGQCSGIDDAQRRHITENPQLYLMKVLEISAMERTADGHFRHPVAKTWRTDKESKDCLWMQ